MSDFGKKCWLYKQYLDEAPFPEIPALILERYKGSQCFYCSLWTIYVLGSVFSSSS